MSADQEVSKNKPWWRALIGALLAVAVSGAVVDLKSTKQFGQIDLRNRVVGARLMLADKDPYTFHWQASDSPLLLDPVIPPGSFLTKTTVTPTVLAFHAMFSWLGYHTQKYLWLGAQWLLYAAIVGFALSLSKDREVRWLILGTGLAFFCCPFWRQHVEAGQIPILYGFFAATYIHGLRKTSASAEICNGIVLGILVGLRPQFALLGMPLLVYLRWRLVAGAVLGAGLGVGVPLAISPQVWSQYLRTIQVYLWPGAHSSGVPIAVRPEEIEGLTNIKLFSPFSYLDSTVPGLLKLAGWKVPSTVFLGLIALAAAGWMVRIWQEKRVGAPIQFVSAGTVGLVLLTDLLLPIKRLIYADAILVPIALLLLATAERSLVQSARSLGLLLVTILFAMQIRSAYLSTLLPSFCIVALTLAVRWKDKPQTY